MENVRNSTEPLPFRIDHNELSGEGRILLNSTLDFEMIESYIFLVCLCVSVCGCVWVIMCECVWMYLCDNVCVCVSVCVIMYECVCVGVCVIMCE